MTNLIPFALSSQLDETGEERIHAAGGIRTTRAAFTMPPQAFAYIAIDDNTIFDPQMYYCEMNTSDYTYSVVDNVALPERSFTEFTTIENNGVDTLFVCGASNNHYSIYPASFVAGSLSLGTELRKYIGGWSTYWEVLKCEWSTVHNVLFCANLQSYTSSDQRLTISAISYDPSTRSLTIVDEDILLAGNSTAVQYGCNMCMHGNYIIAYCNKANKMYAYSFSGGTLTQIASIVLSGIVTGHGNISTLRSDGNYIYVTGNFFGTTPGLSKTLAFDGTSFSTVQTFTVDAAYQVVYDVLQVDNDKYIVHSFLDDNTSVADIFPITSGSVGTTYSDRVAGIVSQNGYKMVYDQSRSWLLVPTNIGKTGISGIWSIGTDGSASQVKNEFLLDVLDTTAALNPQGIAFNLTPRIT